ncbi:MAG: cytochrome c4 [Betaproteobacteria bacterium]|nr:cytochrome c4 [Betaproteobacteria bacterium]
MNVRTVTLVVALAGLGAACTNLERSRDLGNPKVPAETLAAQVCSNCHGLDGNSISPNFPHLAGAPEPYLEKQLKAFKGHNRLDPAGFEYMWGLSRFLSDEQITGLAAYYAKQQPVSPGVSENHQLVAEGRNIFEKGLPDKNIPPCAVCHGQSGQGNGEYPRLAFQHEDYLVKQLTVFQRTDQRPEGAVMKTIAHGLELGDMKAVAAFLQEFPAQ